MNADLERHLSLQVQAILASHSTQPLQALLKQIANNLSLQPFELGAALVYLEASALAACRQVTDASLIEEQPATLPEHTTEIDLKKHLAEQLALALQIPEIQPEKHRMVRYRIEIGQNHQVSIEDIKRVLINESGVDRNKIGHLEIRGTYTLIDLPPGMPPDIFQLLQTVEIKQRALQIKRVNNSRKKSWQRRKPGQKPDYDVRIRETADYQP